MQFQVLSRSNLTLFANYTNDNRLKNNNKSSDHWSVVSPALSLAYVWEEIMSQCALRGVRRVHGLFKSARTGFSPVRQRLSNTPKSFSQSSRDRREAWRPRKSALSALATGAWHLHCVVVLHWFEFYSNNANLLWVFLTKV